MFNRKKKEIMTLKGALSIAMRNISITERLCDLQQDFIVSKFGRIFDEASRKDLWRLGYLHEHSKVVVTNPEKYQERTKEEVVNFLKETDAVIRYIDLHNTGMGKKLRDQIDGYRLIILSMRDCVFHFGSFNEDQQTTLTKTIEIVYSLIVPKEV